MMKVLIADDEVPIREWLVQCVNKIGSDYQVVGVARNGEEALEIIGEKMPDIVITDITMPKKDGIEMLKEIKELDLPIDVILLTCHSDFEFARLSTKYGASDYILKSEISFELVSKLLQDSVDRLKSRGNSSNESSKSLMHITRSHFLRNIINSEHSMDINHEELKKNQIEIYNAPFFVITFRYCEEAIEQIELQKKRWMIKAVLFEYRENSIMMIYNVDPALSQSLQVNSINELRNIIKKYAGGNVGYSKIYYEISYFQTAIKEAVNLRDMLFYNPLMQYSIETINKSNEKETKRTIMEFINNIVESLKVYEKQRSSDLLSEMFNFIYNNKLFDIHFIKKNLADMLERIMGITSDVELNCERIRYDIMSMETLEKLKEYILDVYGYLELSYRKYTDNIQQAMEYINNHYMEQVGLSELASVTYLNEEYFSRLFKKEVGMNFSKYLTNVRMGKARKLLVSTNLTINEVAQRVGIPNTSYFSLLFKKQFNISPYEVQKTAICK